MTSLPPPSAYATTKDQCYNTSNTIYNVAGVWDRSLSYQYGRIDDTGTGNPWGANNNSLTCKYMSPALNFTSNFINVYDRDANQNPGMVLARIFPAGTPINWWAVSFTMQCNYRNNPDTDGRRNLNFYVDDIGNVKITQLIRNCWDGAISTSFNGTTISPTLAGATSQQPISRATLVDPFFSSFNKYTILGYSGKVMMIIGANVYKNANMSGSNVMAPGRIVFANNGGYSNIEVMVSNLKYGYY
jgi:hypothetical protein